MKLPEPPPPWDRIFAQDIDKITALLRSEEVRTLVDKANDEYLHWERAKYIKMPDNLKPEDIWSIIKFNRIQNIKHLPLLDTHGRKFGYWLPESALRELHFVDQNAGGSLLIEHPSLSAEARERYLISSLMEEAIASSQIEGAATTRKIAKEMLRTARQPRTKAERMILNNYVTIRKIRDFIGKPLTVEILHELQKSLTEGTLEDPSHGGRFRTEDDPVLVVDESDGQTLHVPPPAAELPARIEKFLIFANDKSDRPFIHPVIRAIILHFWLAYDHPYVDGNGRTARAVFYWYMLSHDYWLFEYLSISRVILKSVAQYARAYLYAERDDCDITYFIMYHLRAIRVALMELRHYLHKKQREMQETSKLLSGVQELNYRQQALLQHALKHPDAVYTIESHKNSHNVVRATATSDLYDLSDRGFLIKRKQGRRYHFYVASDMVSKIRPNGSTNTPGIAS